MEAPLYPPNEARRVAMLRALDLLDTPSEPVFDSITRLASRLMGTPIALISLVDADRQWFKSKVGMDATQTPREEAFCAHAILGTQAFVVPDAHLDERFADNPCVTGPADVRAYAGIPLLTSEGLALGTLCVIDHQPRYFSQTELDSLWDLAELARHEIFNREVAARARVLTQEDDDLIADSDALFKAIVDQAAVGIAMVGLDGTWLRFNSRLCEILGRTPQALQGATFQDITHPQDLRLDLDHVQRLLDGQADQYSMEKRYVKPDGTIVWAHLTVAVVRRDGRPRYFVSVIDDISERKQTEAALEALRHGLEERVAERTQALQDSRDELDAILHNALDAFICIDDEGCITRWNKQAESTFGWTHDEAVGSKLSELLIPFTHRQAHEAGMAHMLRTGEAPVMGQRLELPAIHKSGAIIPCEVAISTLPRHGGRGTYFAFLHDISIRQRAEQARAASERRLRMIADNLPALIAYVDTQERYQFCNRTYATWLGVDPVTAIDRPVLDVLGEEPYKQRRDLLRQALQGERAEFDIESRMGSRVRHLHLVYLPDLSDAGEVDGVYVLGIDVTDAKQVHKQLIQLVRSDPLTGLPNRRAFEDMFEHALARQRRTERPLALAFLDVDGFKLINDTYGHAIGDEVLRAFALRLTSCVRVTDTVARLGGDEFVIILEGLQQAHEADIVARKIIHAFALPLDLSVDMVLDVRTSVGVAYQARGRLSAPQLIEAADVALYEAKAAGRNTFRVVQTDPPPQARVTASPMSGA